MSFTRRDALTLTAAAVAGSAGCASTSTAAAATPQAQPQPLPGSPVTLPDRKSFSLGNTVYLNAGSQHPFSKQARASIDAYLKHRENHAPDDDYELGGRDAIAKFAKLVNATPEEITWVQSTTAGEQMVVRSLGLPQRGAKVVTDTLHFFGSFPLYGELERQGCEVAWVEAKDGRISLEDMDRAITPGTKLVSLSLVSTMNGFQHDLKAVCDLAHSRGALVFADIIHAAGCVPVDLHGSGVDFASTASYKWLMGDFGLGFLYVRKGALEKLVRTNYGYYGISQFTTHMYPFDPPGDELVEYGFSDNASGWFALGTHAHSVIAQLNASLDYILGVGVEAIQAHAQTLIPVLREGLRSRGFEIMTPEEAQTPIITAVYENAHQVIRPRMQEAGIVTTVSRNRFRPTVSVFNTKDDIEAFLEAAGTA